MKTMRDYRWSSRLIWTTVRHNIKKLKTNTRKWKWKWDWTRIKSQNSVQMIMMILVCLLLMIILLMIMIISTILLLLLVQIQMLLAARTSWFVMLKRLGLKILNKKSLKSSKQLRQRLMLRYKIYKNGS